MTEGEMVGWQHQLNGYEFEQAPGDGERQGSLVCCSLVGQKEQDMTEWLNNNNNQSYCLENSVDREAQQATLHGVAKSQT